MSETLIDKTESFLRNVRNGNHRDAKIQLKSYSRKERFYCIKYAEHQINSRMLWTYIQICIEGEFDK